MTLRAKTDFRLVRRIVAGFADYRWHLVLVLVSIIFTTLLGLASAVLIREIFDHAIGRKDLGRLVLYTGLLFVVPVAANVVGLARSALSIWIGQRVVGAMRMQLYRHLQCMSLRFYTSTQAGEVQSRLTNDVTGVQGVVTTTLPNLITNLSTVTGLVVAMGYLSPLLTLMSLAILPVFLVVNHRVGKMRRAISRKRQETLSQLSGVISETLSLNGVLLMRTFGREERAHQQFGRHNDMLGDLELQQQTAGRVRTLVIGTIFAAIPALIYLIAGWQMITGETVLGAAMTAGGLIAFTTLQARFFTPVTQLFALQTEIQSGLAKFERIFEYLDLRVDIKDRPDARILLAGQIRGEVVFDRVSFAYASVPDRPAAGARAPKAGVRDFSLRIPAGKVVALVGPSGAGKTTVAYLLLRLYDVDAGRISIDGHDVRDIRQASLADLVGVVMQETYLLHASVRENLLYGRHDATEAEMIAAAKGAAIHDRIVEWSSGYDTVVGERGYALSGGERQRLAIARIMLKNPPILVLDEATSALDSCSERLVQEALNRLVRGRTTLIIAHRLSTIMAADQIVVMDHGAVVESGTHRELLAQGQLYARLHAQQFAPTDKS